MEESAIDRLQTECAGNWTQMLALRESSRVTRETIGTLLNEQRLTPCDTAVVAIGSVARGEWTSGSDVDWTLLVDGQVDQSHLTVAQQIARTLNKNGFKGPNQSGAFGQIVFSHHLVHRIGGESDSNKNTTQRILLLLESVSLGGDASVRERVMRQLYKRYIEEDQSYRHSIGRPPTVPHFLLNDFARYWRTMAVDFAAKRRERLGEGWAIRSFKLRMSRKLLFADGLAMCLQCKIRPAPILMRDFQSDDEFCAAMSEYLLSFSQRSPLENLATMLLEFNAALPGKEIFDAYEDFLAVLADTESRDHLENLPIENARDDSIFQNARAIGKRFQDGLTKFFFDSNDELTNASKRYGVF